LLGDESVSWTFTTATQSPPHQTVFYSIEDDEERDGNQSTQDDYILSIRYIS
jgi:hypothetical protein